MTVTHTSTLKFPNNIASYLEVEKPTLTTQIYKIETSPLNF
jgi:hypothetical protein